RRTKHESGDAGDVLDFNWEDYLEENGAVAVPHHSFRHVDQDLQSGLTPGMKLEVCVRSEVDNPYWVANIITTCGQLLLLRYEGHQEDRRADFWCDIMTADLHALGWSRQHGKTMRPPQGVREKHQDWEALLEKALAEECSAPASLLELPQRGRDPVELLCSGCYVELQDGADPGLAWAAEVEENVGGRLKLRLLGTEGLTGTPATLWLFYLHPRLHPPGWAKEHGCTLKPPSESDGPGRSFLCHRDSPGIFPVQWSLKNGLPLCPPPGYQGPDFDWADYLKQCEAEAAPQHCFPDQSEHGFKEAMKLEAVNPLSPENIHVATVTKVKGQYVWLNLEGLKQPMPELIVHVDSLDVFPISWCETNGYPLVYPIKPSVEKERKIAVVQPEKHSLCGVFLCTLFGFYLICTHFVLIGQGNGKYCCPKIYFNHRCFSGPYLNKGRIAELPQFIGPGNCVLVLKEVLTLLINSAYKPSRVLRELQLDQESRWQGYGETLKAKYKGKSYRATVEIVRTADRVADFCRNTCIKLECCPNLFGPRMVLERCSENCSVLTKTKYTYYYGKKKSKRVGRPPGGHSNLEGGVKRRGRRRKRRKQLFVHKKRRSSASVDNTPGSGDEEDLDDDESLSDDSGSEIQDDLQDDSEPSLGKSQPTTPTPSPPPTPRPTRRRRKPRSPSFSDDENHPPSPKTSRPEPPQKLCLDTNPLEWSVTDVIRFLRTTDCAPLARIFKDQEIDGQALLLLNLPTVQECMDLKLGPAIKLCHHIERVKLAFYQQFAT
uniref:SAM domain-containing protein n=1 Tax=Gouania willdenowi TaxID=441366 RepID=A0A8C5DW61_GOUWI